MGIVLCAVFQAPVGGVNRDMEHLGCLVFQKPADGALGSLSPDLPRRGPGSSAFCVLLVNEMIWL